MSEEREQTKSGSKKSLILKVVIALIVVGLLITLGFLIKKKYSNNMMSVKRTIVTRRRVVRSGTQTHSQTGNTQRVSSPVPVVVTTQEATKPATKAAEEPQAEGSDE